MAVDTSDPMGGKVQGLTTLEELLRKARESEPTGTEAGDDGNPVLPSYEWQDQTQNQIRSEDDDDGDVTPETEGPGKPPL